MVATHRGNLALLRRRHRGGPDFAPRQGEGADGTRGCIGAHHAYDPPAGPAGLNPAATSTLVTTIHNTGLLWGRSDVAVTG